MENEDGGCWWPTSWWRCPFELDHRLLRGDVKQATAPDLIKAAVAKLNLESGLKTELNQELSSFSPGRERGVKQGTSNLRGRKSKGPTWSGEGGEARHQQLERKEEQRSNLVGRGG